MKKGLKSFANGFMGVMTGFMFVAAITYIDNVLDKYGELNGLMLRVEQALINLEGVDI